MQPLTRVKNAQKKRASAMREYREAVHAAREAGHSLPEIARAAGVSHVAILKTLRSE